MVENYEYFYPGTPYSLEPTYGDFQSGERLSASELGLTLDPRTADILREVTNKTNTGVRVIEASILSSDISGSIPKQHLKELNRLSKLTGTEVTVHGVLVEPSGFTREGGWSEINREIGEREMMEVIEKAHEIDPKGNIPVTFHSSVLLPEGEEKVKVGDEEKIKSMMVIEPETGRIFQLKEHERYFPGESKEFVPEKELEMQNEELWRDRMTHLTFNTARGSEAIESVKEYEKFYEMIKGKNLEEVPEEMRNTYKELSENYERNLTIGKVFLRDAYRELRDMYDKAYRSAKETGKEEDLKKLEEFGKEVERRIKDSEKDPAVLADILQKGVSTFEKLEEVPQIFQPLSKFALEQSSETFANVAFESYKKYGDKSPIVSIENPPAGGAMSRAEDLKKLIELAREKFVEKITKEGYKKNEAKELAEKIIGATWDIGHINMLRRYGYDKADLIKETEKISPLVKHVHLSDNFGLEHTELPMGMGNVPFKEMLKKISKEDIKKIIETGNWYQHFKTIPLKESLEAMGSPIYQLRNAPYWNQSIGFWQGYFSGYGIFLPEQHFSLYGGGFSNLPTELGGQISGRQARFGGTPMA